jgi:hypothetical protein
MPEIQIPSIVLTLLQVILAFSGAFLIALWLSLVVWTFRDARSRSRDIFAILLATLMVVVFGPLGLMLYFLLRPPVTLAELYERSLEEEALLQDLEERPRCPGCSRQVDDKWIICPDCHTTLKKNCPTCENSLHLTWNICPFCGAQVAVVTPHLDNNNYHGPSGLTATETQPMAVKEPVHSAQTIGQPVFPPPHRNDEGQPAFPPPRRNDEGQPAFPPPSRNDDTRPQIPQTGPA